MGKQIFIGLATEGTTDVRFLESIVKRTFEDIALKECQQDIDIYIFVSETAKQGLSFPEYVLQASTDGLKTWGIMTLAIHTDADRNTLHERMENKIRPAQELLGKQGEEYCKLLTPIIPVRMIEAWMLADKELFKEEIGTSKPDAELGINRDPESMADPKQAIENAIRIATEHLPKRRQRLSISELYEIIGDTISLEALSTLDSYKHFKEAVRTTYKALNYLQE